MPVQKTPPNKLLPNSLYSLSLFIYLTTLIFPALCLLNQTSLIIISIIHTSSLYPRYNTISLELLISICSIIAPILLITTGFITNIYVISAITAALGLIGMHKQLPDMFKGIKILHTSFKYFSKKVNNTLKGPRKILESIADLKSGYNTLSNPILGFTTPEGKKAARWIKIKLIIYLTVQCSISYLSFKSIGTTKILFDAIRDKAKTTLYRSIYILTALELSKRLIRSLLSYVKRYISIGWQTKIRSGLIDTILNSKKQNYTDIQRIPMDGIAMSISTSQIFDEDIDALIDYTIIATSQLTSVILDVGLTGYIIYVHSPILFNVALVYLTLSTTAFAFWEKMSNCFSQCKNLRSKFRNKIERLLGSWISLKLSDTHILTIAKKELTKDFNSFKEKYIEKIKWDRLGGTSKIIASTIIPMCCYVLAPEILSGALSFGSFMAARKAFKQFYESVSQLLGNIKMYVNFSTTAKRVNNLLDTIEVSNNSSPTSNSFTYDQTESDYLVKIPKGTKIIRQASSVSTEEDKTIVCLDKEIIINKGERSMYQGENGGGKSLFFKLIAGCITPKDSNNTSSIVYEVPENKKIHTTKNIVFSIQQQQGTDKYHPEPTQESNTQDHQDMNTHERQIRDYLPIDCVIPDEIKEWSTSDAYNADDRGLGFDITTPAKSSSGGMTAFQDMIRILTLIHPDNETKQPAPDLIMLDEITSPVTPEIIANFRKKLLAVISLRQKQEDNYNPAITEISHKDHESKHSKADRNEHWSKSNWTQSCYNAERIVGCTTFVRR